MKAKWSVKKSVSPADKSLHNIHITQESVSSVKDKKRIPPFPMLAVANLKS